MTRARRCCVGLLSVVFVLLRGRYQTRTDDLFGVNEARYQLRQSPPALFVRIDTSGSPAVHRTHRAARVWRAARTGCRTAPIRMNSGDTPGERGGFWWKCPGAYRVYVVAATAERQVRMWRSGSASPCQGEGREFESRHPLECGSSRRPATHQRVSHRSGTHGDVNLDGGVAERLGSGLQSRPRGFESRPHLQIHPPRP